MNKHSALAPNAAGGNFDAQQYVPTWAQRHWQDSGSTACTAAPGCSHQSHQLHWGVLSSGAIWGSVGPADWWVNLVQIVFSVLMVRLSFCINYLSGRKTCYTEMNRCCPVINLIVLIVKHVMDCCSYSEKSMKPTKPGKHPLLGLN